MDSMKCTLVSLVILLFTFLLYKINSYAKTKKKSVLTNWPIVGMLPGLFLNRHRLHSFITEVLHNSDGTFVFKGPWFSNMEMVLTSDPANVNYILSKNFSNYQKGPSFKKIFDVLGDGIFGSEFEIWENQRRIAMSLINHSQFQNFAVKTSWNIVENRFIPFLEHVAELGIQVDMQDLFKRYSFDNTCMLLFGRDLETLCISLPNLKQEKAFTDMEEAVMNRHIIPEICWKFQKWLQIGHEKKLREAKQVVDQFLTDCISLKCQKLKVRNEEEEDLDLLTNYMKIMAEKSSDSEEISEKVLKDELLNLAFAGKNAIGACLAWLFWLLATNPKEENKIRQEILKFSPVGKWKFSSMEELKKMVYLHGAICESLRLYPPVALQHKAPVKPDILPTGQPINANTKTVLSFYSMGRMESIWGEDCLEFKPGRWISEGGGIKHEQSFKFTAFNAGPKSCLGKELSFIQMKIAAAAIISRFHINLIKGHRVATPPLSVLIQIKNGLNVQVSRCD